MTKTITYKKETEKEVMEKEITNQFFANTKEFGDSSLDINLKIVMGLKQEGFIDNDLEKSLIRSALNIEKLRKPTDIDEKCLYDLQHCEKDKKLQIISDFLAVLGYNEIANILNNSPKRVEGGHK